jgi:hypothetical protein
MSPSASKFYCDTCNNWYANARVLREHIKSQHKGEIAGVCNHGQCQNKTFKELANWRRHLRVVHGMNINGSALGAVECWFCNDCHYTAERKDNCLRHVVSKHRKGQSIKGLIETQFMTLVTTSTKDEMEVRKAAHTGSNGSSSVLASESNESSPVLASGSNESSSVLVSAVPAPTIPTPAVTTSLDFMERWEEFWRSIKAFSHLDFTDMDEIEIWNGSSFTESDHVDLPTWQLWKQLFGGPPQDLGGYEEAGLEPLEEDSMVLDEDLAISLEQSLNVIMEWNTNSSPEHTSR